MNFCRNLKRLDQDTKPAPIQLPVAELLVIDGTDKTLLGLAAGANIPTQTIDDSSDPIDQLTLRLWDSNTERLHLLVHGSAGVLSIGSTVIDKDALKAKAGLLGSWGIKEIYLWSCGVGADHVFIKTLSELTGADVFSSDTWIGNSNNEQRYEITSYAHPRKSARLNKFISARSLKNQEFRLANVSVYFNDGYLGTQGTNTNQANSIKKFSTLGVDRVAFVQDDTDNDGLFDEVATQGNDIAGTLKLYLTDGTVVSLTGALNWRETTGSRVEVLGFIFGTGQTGTITYNGGASTFNITGGSTANSSTTLGLKAYGSAFTFTDNQNRSGNAATSGLLSALNSQLTATPQPSSISLTGASVTEGTNLVYTVTISAQTTQTQYFSITSSGTASAGTDYNSDFSTFTYSNSVTFVGNDTLRVPSGVTTFTITIPTTNDTTAESSETLILQVGNKTATGTILDNDAGLSYSAGTLTEAAQNNGSISTSITITLSNDTFTGADGDNFVAANKVTVTNLPAGLTAVVTRTSSTTATLTLTGTATSHANANDISNLTLTFGNTAFTGNNAAGVTNSTKNNLVIDYADPAALTYSGTTFTESAANNGAIATTVTITLAGDTFASDVVSANKISIPNAPAGLTPSFTRISDTQVGVTFTGQATSHAVANNITNLEVTFLNGAFTHTATASNVTNYSRNNLSITYADPGVATISYSAGTLSEAGANDGSISTTLTISLSNDTFTGANNTNLITANKVSVTNVPAGLTAVVTKTSDTTATLTLTGNAAVHANANDISNLTVTFLDGAFTTNATASNVTGYQKSNLVVDFTNPAPSLSYSGGTFNEAAANDGTISTTITITLLYDTFVGAANDNLLTAGRASISNVPAGLTAVLTKATNTTATLTLTGNASAHANADDINDLIVTFLNGAFTSTATASNVTGFRKSDLIVDYVNPPPSEDSGPPAAPSFNANLNPASDTGPRDGVTKAIDPNFNINAGNLLVPNGTVRILDNNGKQLGSSTVTQSDVTAGTAKVGVGTLDDGVYTFKSQILDSNGRVVGEAPVTVTIVTDRDGIAPSIELAANNGDFNKDGIKDWEQNNVAQLPLLSLDAFKQGKAASEGSFGAIIAGSLSLQTLASPVKLTDSAQLTDMSVQALPALALPDEHQAVTPLFRFSVTSQDGGVLQDLDTSRPGLQTQTVIDIPVGVKATSFMKYNAAKGNWVDFTNISSLSGGGDGAVLVDSDRDGRVDRVVITLTDGGPGDEDGVVNGTIVDPGALAVTDSEALYASRAKNGDIIVSKSPSKDMLGINFYAAPTAEAGLLKLKAYYNTLTGDYFYAPEGVAPPYACYTEIKDVDLGYVTRPGQGAFDLHLYLNGSGNTQIVSAAYATAHNFLQNGYRDLGAIFGSTEDINIITLIGT